jgi:hypothetical protein
VKKIIASFPTLGLLAISCQFLFPSQSPPAPATQSLLPPVTETSRPVITSTPDSPDWMDRSIFKAGLVPSARPVLSKLDGASVYHIEINIGNDLIHIIGREQVRYTNNEDAALKQVVFRLFPNILGGEMTVDRLTLNGEPVRPRYDLNDSVMIVPFEQPLETGASAVIAMDFTVTVPETVGLNYGVLAYYDNVLALAHAYPMIAVYDDEGWNAEIPPQSGDVTYADMSFFIVKVEAPKRVTLVGAGRETSRRENGSRQTVTYAAGPARDFYLAASPEYKVFTKESGGITLRFYTRDYLREGAEFALDAASRAIEDYSERYAPYPYTELDFVSTPTYALGIEYPGMIAITDWIISPDEMYLEPTVAHEVGHQWFYNLVGNDQLDDPWLDESLTQFVTLQYFTDEYGAAGNEGFRQDLESRWYFIDNAEIPIGLPVREYSDAEYSGIIYGRGGLFFEALRDEIGAEAFDGFMKDYTVSNSWGIATPESLKSIAEKHCNCDLTSLFEEWVY